LLGFEIRNNRFRKIHGNVEMEAGGGLIGDVEAIIKVKEDGYVPPGVTVRSRIDATMLTGEASAGILGQLDDDPKVASVSISRRLRVVE